MLEALSWSQFATFMVAIILLYYFIILIIYYRIEITNLYLKLYGRFFRQNIIEENTSSPILVRSDDKPHTSNSLLKTSKIDPASDDSLVLNTSVGFSNKHPLSYPVSENDRAHPVPLPGSTVIDIPLEAEHLSDAIVDIPLYEDPAMDAEEFIQLFQNGIEGFSSEKRHELENTALYQELFMVNMKENSSEIDAIFSC
ncbi:hypothetical protein Q0590_31050 [Rhodocytophaga aerolata]|uniref:Uncharacterized protein n=1 Tax=Rhodocytophaga aerolata TaxID=455078 RepID=A0ABT8RF65_9BACT|nr:hypothetical protein [Rhodocytophaga aerolata]MDO1450752.1 hypothetical protein [Rhodocytophaga aerolata]